MTNNKAPRSGKIRWADTSMAGLLREKKAELGSLAKLASAAGVSSTTIDTIFNDEFDPEEVHRNASEPSIARDRRHAGFASSLTRLCLLLDPRRKVLDPYTLAKEYRLNETPRVLESIKSVLREESRTAGADDAVLSAIRARRLEDDSARGGEFGVVRVGLLAWDPFHRVGAEDSFANIYTTALVRAALPECAIQLKTYTNTSDCINAILESRDCDIAFGIYPAPGRIADGLEFLTLNGIESKTMALRPAGSDITWKQILAKRYYPRSRPLRATVLKDELSHLFLQGVCGYRSTAEPKELVVLRQDMRSSSGPSIGEALLSESKKLPSTDLIFVSDPGTCLDVLKQLNELAGELMWEIVDSEDELLAPSYGIGIALRSDAPAWLRLLNYANENELYSNWALNIAHLYVALFSTELGGKHYRWDWSLVPAKTRLKLSQAAKCIADSTQHKVEHPSEPLKNFLRGPTNTPDQY